MTLMAVAEEVALKCNGCGSKVVVESEMSSEKLTDQTAYAESLQQYLDDCGGVYCVDCL